MVGCKKQIAGMTSEAEVGAQMLEDKHKHRANWE